MIWSNNSPVECLKTIRTCEGVGEKRRAPDRRRPCGVLAAVGLSADQANYDISKGGGQAAMNG